MLALNKFDGVFTIDSCEGSKTKAAYIYFKYGSSPKDLAIFCSILAEKISPHIKGSNEYVLRVEWDYDFSTNMAILMTSQKNIHKLNKAIDFVVNNLHKTSFFCDK